MSKRGVKPISVITEESDCEEPENMPIPEYVFNSDELDKKYPDASVLGGFKVYFGKFKGKTYDDVIGDLKYCRFVMRFENVKSNGVYLLKKYISLMVPPADLVSPKAKPTYKRKPARTV